MFIKSEDPLPYADHVFTTRDMSGETVEETVEHASEVIGPIAWMRQVHGDRIAYAEGPGVYPEVDALITDVEGLWLAVATADCLPVLISAPRVVAAVHAGWRGLEKQVVTKVLHKMIADFRVSAADIHVLIGPAIQQEHYEVEEHFTEMFDESFFSPSPNEGIVLMDLPGIAMQQAVDTGVTPEQVVDMGIDTYSETDMLLSYRRAKEDGLFLPERQLALIRCAVEGSEI